MTHTEEFWGAERILDEKVESGVSYFLIKWLGEDFKGDPWKPTWEPEGNCTDALIREWKVVKGDRKVEESRSTERKLSVVSCDTLSEGGDGGVVGVVGDYHDSSETSTIIDEDEDESQNDAEVTSKENPNTTATSSILSAVANLMGISTSQKRPPSDSNGDELINEAKKIRTRESLDDEESNIIREKKEVTVVQQPSHIQTSTKVVQQNPSFHANNDSVVSDTSSMSVRHARNNSGSHVYPDTSSLANEIISKNNFITYLLQEKEYFQKKLKQYEKNRKFHQSKNLILSQDNIQTRKSLKDKQIEITRIYAELERVHGEFDKSRELCNKKDAKMKAMEIELEEHKKQFDAKHKKDQKQIALLKKTNNNLTVENKKLLEKTETLKAFGIPISSDFSHLGQTTRSTGNVQALRAENERLTSQINNMNLQCSLQRQNLIVLEEKVVEQESLIRLLMDIRKTSHQGDQRTAGLKRSINRSVNLPFPNTPPVYARPPNPVQSLPPLEFIPWNGMPLKN